MTEWLYPLCMVATIALAAVAIERADARADRRWRGAQERAEGAYRAEVDALLEELGAVRRDAATERRQMVDAFLAMQSGSSAARAAAIMREADRPRPSLEEMVASLPPARGVREDDDPVQIVPIGMGG